MFLSRSLPNGNCLFSSISLVKFANNKLTDTLRILCALELFLKAEFYARHPILVSAYNKARKVDGKQLFSSFESVFDIARSFTSDNQKKLNNMKLVEQEAIHICSDNVWASFLCVLSLSSVIKQNIELLYPDSAPIRFQKVYRQLVVPRKQVNDNRKINILWCWFGKSQNPIHFVPVIMKTIKSASKKRKLNTNDTNVTKKVSILLNLR